MAFSVFGVVPFHIVCANTDNNSSHSHQQAGAGTPLRGARALNVKLSGD
jgi:hypothetical protein